MIRAWLLRRYGKLLSFLVSQLDEINVLAVLIRVVENTVDKNPANEGLRFLLETDSQLYPIQSSTAIRYELEAHPKHRLTDYHDFFLNNVALGERVIDVGCGKGSVAYDLAKNSRARVLGIDINQASIAVAQKTYQHKDLRFRAGDALKLNTVELFDTVVLSNVLEHIVDRVMFLKKLINVTGATKFLIRVPTYERDWRIPLKRELGVDWRLDNDHKTEFTISSFSEEIKHAGLDIVNFNVQWVEI